MRWRRRARAQLDLEPRCEPCLRTGRIAIATVADHVVQWRLAEDPDTAFWGGALQSVCSECHQSKRQSERLGRAWRPKTATGPDGLPTDKNDPWYSG